MPELQGKVAVVTGGSRGIGFAVAQAIVAAGGSVAIGARTQADVDTAVRALNGSDDGGRATGIACDVRSQSDCEQLIQHTIDAFGGVDILVNNAGIGRFAPVREMKPDDWRAVIETNLNSLFYCTHAALPHLAARGESWVINIGSLAGKNPFPNGAAYNASKFGLIGFSEDAWKVQPEDIAQLVTDLLSMPQRTLPSRIEVRPSQPPKK